MIIAAFTLGACINEKYFNLNWNMGEWDFKMSVKVYKMKDILSNTSRISNAFGSFNIKVTESDEKKKGVRRGDIKIKEMKKGKIIKDDYIKYEKLASKFDLEMTNFLLEEL